MRKIKNYQEYTNEEINLKKALTTGALAASMLGNTSLAQMNKINPAEPKKVEISDFDSSKVSTLTLKEMIGQNFIITETDPIIAQFFKTVKDLKKIPNSDKRVNDIFGRTIKLLEITPEDTLNYDELVNKGSERIASILKFEDQTTKEILYYRYFEWISTTLSDADYEITKPPTVPFVSLGFLEKFNKKMNGVSYGLNGVEFYRLIKNIAHEFGHDKMLTYSDIYINNSRVREDENSNYDIKTGRKISAEEKKLCKFEGVVLNEKTKKLSFLFTSDDISFLIDLPRDYFSKMSIK